MFFITDARADAVMPTEEEMNKIPVLKLDDLGKEKKVIIREEKRDTADPQKSKAPVKRKSLHKKKP